MNILKGLLIILAIIVLALIAIKIVLPLLAWVSEALVVFIILTIIAVLTMFLYRSKEASVEQENHPMSVSSLIKGKLSGRIAGVIFCVLGVVSVIWVISRFTSLAGKLHTWEPPFTEYEIITLVGVGITALFLIVGLILLMLGYTKK